MADSYGFVLQVTYICVIASRIIPYATTLLLVHSPLAR